MISSRNGNIEIVPSASLIPKGDATLLFTNAGMVPFKDYFLGIRTPAARRVVDCQKCLRISGKHNDLEAVGRDTYHHTFFEMLGNWSFGDYYKEAAIPWHWELITKVWKIPADRLWATIYTDDDEAEAVWKKIPDLLPGRILRFEKENFWEMGDTGPMRSVLGDPLRSRRGRVQGRDASDRDRNARSTSKDASASSSSATWFSSSTTATPRAS